MRIPGSAGSWIVVVTLVVLAMGVGIASVATSPSGHSARKAVPTTSLPPTTRTTVPPTTSTSVPAPSEGMAQVTFLNPQDGYGLVVQQGSGTCDSAVASTTDGGNTFSKPVPVTAWTCVNGYQETSLAFDGAGDGFVYGPGLHVSHDAGMTWTDQSSTGATFDVVPMGRSIWMLQTPCSNPIPGPCPVTLDESSDGGRTWVPSATFPSVMEASNQAPPWLSLKWVVRSSSSKAFIVVPTTPTAATLLFTFDGGRTWNHSLIPCLGGWAESLSQGFDQTLWLACAGQPSAGNQLKSVLRSLDGGREWVQGSSCPPVVTSTTYPACAVNELTPGYLTDIGALSGTTAFMAGGRSSVSVTHDGGKTWMPTNPPIGNDADGGSGGLFFVNPQDGWVLLNPLGAGAVWRTTDGGVSWRQVWPPPTEQVCQPSQLTLTKGSYGEAAVQFTQTLTFTNASLGTCQLGGWPGFQVEDAGGHLVPTTTQRVRQNDPSHPPWTTVVLAPQQTASFDVYSADFDAVHNHACPMTSAVAITPPGDSSPLSVHLDIPDCGSFLIAPVIAGSTDTNAWSLIVG